VLLMTPAQASAQMPDEFTNLQVLPQDIAQEELIGLMKSVTQALGVRCNHCHINNGDSFDDFEFALDENEHKGIAREMIKMVRAINNDLLPAPMHAEAGRRVTCNTCHRGETTPAR
jgi:hypothetical protein